MRHRELIEEVGPQEGHCFFALLAVPERTHVCFAIPQRDGIPRVGVVLISGEPLIPQSLHFTSQGNGLLVRCFKRIPLTGRNPTPDETHVHITSPRSALWPAPLRACRPPTPSGDHHPPGAAPSACAWRLRRLSAHATYARPALRKLLAALPAASKVAAASLAVMATVVSMSDRLPPAAAARTAEAATFSSGNSPMTRKSWCPNVRYQPMSLPPTLLNKLATASSRFSGLASIPLTASAVNLPRDM